MIQSFRDAATHDFFRDGKHRRFGSIAVTALRKLDQLNAASTLNDLRIPPGNQLELLRGDRAGQNSIRINNQFRICFVWKADGPHDVEIVDYH